MEDEYSQMHGEFHDRSSSRGNKVGDELKLKRLAGAMWAVTGSGLD